jgi:hypothetical protein
VYSLLIIILMAYTMMINASKALQFCELDDLVVVVIAISKLFLCQPVRNVKVGHVSPHPLGFVESHAYGDIDCSFQVFSLSPDILKRILLSPKVEATALVRCQQPAKEVDKKGGPHDRQVI